jgi:hypothetical protein
MKLMNPILPCNVLFFLNSQSYPYQQDAKLEKKKTVYNIPLRFTRQHVASENKPVTWIVSNAEVDSTRIKPILLM